MKDILTIVRRNTFQPIVIAILILAATLLFLGERRDAWFVSFVIIVNTLIAIIQEIRAMRALRKLELMNAPKARRINHDGTVDDVSFEDLVVGDEIDVRLGDEIPADATVKASQGLEANESMLTGESAGVPKEKNDTVYASSSVIAGSAICVVSAIGEATKVGVMSSSLKRYRPQPTPLQRSIAILITIMTYGALGLAALIFVVYLFSGQDPITIVKTITSAAVTVVPEGLLLASTLLLAFGSLKLAQAKVLPQKLAAIEAMALLKNLCVDKTGTLTSDEIEFETIETIGNPSKSSLEAIGIAALETSGGNATGDALISGIGAPEIYTVKEQLAFSSSRKYSAVRIQLGKHTETIAIGAPESLAKFVTLPEDVSNTMTRLAREGKRVLLAVRFDDSKRPLRELKAHSGTAIAYMVLVNELRSGVTKTVSFLQKNGVRIRVISGDNPDTVQAVAAQAGIKNADQVITGAELEKLSDDQWEEAMTRTTIFARVLPEQKEALIAFLQKDGSFTGMVGDGVNDALALKKADLGVAMFAGAVATRRVADIVLLNNSFNSLPLGMRLGNRIMLAIEMIATLFFHKIIYGVILLLTTIILGVVYPFEPRHNTFMNIFLVTLPTIMWTLFTPVPSYKIQPRSFWKDTLLSVLPIALISGLTVAVSYVGLFQLHADDREGVITTTVLIATLLGVYLVFLVGKMFNVVMNRTTKLARTLYLLTVLFVVAVSFGFGFTRDFFDFTAPAWQGLLPIGLFILCSMGVQYSIAVRISRVRKKR